ncbi:MAG: TrmB family transcriptional regulator [Candidatus Woesearchaeota archaeon]
MQFEELKELGLDENEIKAYTACLQDGGATVKDIAKNSGIIRTTAYGILQSLQKKGLVSKIDKNGIVYFHAIPPTELLNILDQKREKVASIINDLERIKSIIPQSQKIDFFEGRSGVKIVNNDIISKPNETIKIISDMNKWLEFSEGYTSTYYRKKKEANVKTQTILEDTTKERERSKSSKVKNTQFRFQKNLNTDNCSIFIYHDKVSFVIYNGNEVGGFIITNKAFNKIQNMLFDKLWDKAKK